MPTPPRRPASLNSYFAVARWLVIEAGYEYDPFDDMGAQFANCDLQRPSTPPRCFAPFAVAVERFERIPESERRAWVRSNLAAIRAGGVGMEDVP